MKPVLHYIIIIITTTKMINLFKYIIPFKGISFLDDYFNTIQNIRLNSKSKLKFKIFISAIHLKSVYFLYLALMPLSTEQRLLHYDYIYFIFDNSSINYIASGLMQMLAYIICIFYIKSNYQNNRLLSDIVCKFNNTFFLYSIDSNGRNICLAIRRHLLNVFNLTQCFQLLIGNCYRITVIP